MRIDVEFLKSLEGWNECDLDAFREFLVGRDHITDTIEDLQAAADAGLDVLWWIEAGELTVEGIATQGARHWYKNGKEHREGAPAAECFSGAEFWYQNGLLHRDDGGPAVVNIKGTQRWYQNGLLHRDDGGPAVVRANGDCVWYEDGNWIREERP